MVGVRQRMQCGHLVGGRLERPGAGTRELGFTVGPVQRGGVDPEEA